MEDQFQILFDKMKIEMQKQTVELKKSITNTIMEKIDKKLKPLIDENKDLKIKLGNLEKEIEYLKREKKKNNIIIFRIEEDEDSTARLIQKVKNIFNKELDVIIGEHEINKIYRIGKKRSDGKSRPILLTFANIWQKKRNNESPKKSQRYIYYRGLF